VDLALELIPEDHGLARKIRAFRSEVGMKRVAERLEGGFTGEDPLDEALAEIEALLAEDPDKVDLLRQKVKILVAMGRDEVAEELARKVFAHAQKAQDPSAIRDAVELLDAVSTGREALRRSSRLDSLDRLVADGNWRAAEQLFRELAIGQDDDLELIARHVEILIGLRKVRLARERIAKLSGHSEIKDRRRILEARLSCLEHMAAKGGDVYAAYELYERRDFKRCQALLQMLSQADAQETGVRFLNAVCQSHLEGPERADPIVAQARQRATEDDAFWVIELLETELAT
jgi:thioredoxin-like negative regulator of GroEL